MKAKANSAPALTCTVLSVTCGTVGELQLWLGSPLPTPSDLEATVHMAQALPTAPAWDSLLSSTTLRKTMPLQQAKKPAPHH